MERREQSNTGRQTESDEYLRQVIPDADGKPNYYPEETKRSTIVPFKLPEQGHDADVHHQIDNHPLPKHIPEKDRRAEVEKLISGGKDPADLEEFLAANIDDIAA